MPGHHAAPDPDSYLSVRLAAVPCRTLLVPASSDFLDADGLAADEIGDFRPRVLEAAGENRSATTGAMVPWT
jgi:hypothetical protein